VYTQESMLRRDRRGMTEEKSNDALLHDTRLYARIVSMKSNLAISRQVIFDTYLGKIKNFKFRDYMVQSGFREIDPPGWPPFTIQRAIEFNETQLAIRMMGLSEVRVDQRRSSSHEKQNAKVLKRDSREGVASSSPSSGSRAERSNKCFSCGHATTQGLSTQEQTWMGYSRSLVKAVDFGCRVS
jgi:hypothetical protein